MSKNRTLFTLVIEDKKPRNQVLMDIISKRRYGYVISDKKKYSRKEKYKKDWSKED